MNGLTDLAREARIAVDWQDAGAVRRHVGVDSLRAILQALGYPAQNSRQVAESRARLRHELSLFNKARP
jgi:4-alpha-glucanotransferase